MNAAARHGVVPVSVLVRSRVAHWVREALEMRGARIAAFEPYERPADAIRVLDAWLQTRGSRAFGIVDPNGLDPDDARTIAGAAAQVGRQVVVFAPRCGPKVRANARRTSPFSWPLPSPIAWRGFLAGLGLAPAADLGAWVEALLLIGAPPRGRRIEIKGPEYVVGMAPQELPPALSLRSTGRAAVAGPVPMPHARAPVEDLLRLPDRMRGIAVLIEALPPGLPPPSSGETKERGRFVMERSGREPGEHDAKLLLAAYGIHVSRQAVARSPSAATRLADRIGYPVDVRAAVGGLSAEEQGAPVVAGVLNAPGVRRAYTTVNFDQERLTGRALEAAIVREHPPHGPRLRVGVFRHSRLGWLATIAPPPLCGEPRPAVACAALPLSEKAALHFAEASPVSTLLPSGRFGGASAAGIADVIMRLSRLVLDLDDVLNEVAIEQLVCTVQRRAIAFEARIIRR